MKDLTFNEDYDILQEMITETEEAYAEALRGERKDRNQLLEELMKLYEDRDQMSEEHGLALKKKEGR